jgi:hypothetical protein
VLYTVAQIDFTWFCGKLKVWAVTLKEGTTYGEEEGSEKQNLTNVAWCKVPFQVI